MRIGPSTRRSCAPCCGEEGAYRALRPPSCRAEALLKPRRLVSTLEASLSLPEPTALLRWGSALKILKLPFF